MGLREVLIALLRAAAKGFLAYVKLSDQSWFTLGCECSGTKKSNVLLLRLRL